MPDIKYHYGEAAERVVPKEGWACRNCGRWWGDNLESEHMARWCCTKENTCDMCGKLVRYRIRCWKCSTIDRAKRHDSAERVEWDGETPLCEWDSDRFFWDVGELVDYLSDEALDLDDIRLCVATPGKPRLFSFHDHLDDNLPEEAELPDGWEKLENHVNAFIKKHAPYSWWAGNKVPSRESLEKAIGESCLAGIKAGAAERRAEDAAERQSEGGGA